MIANLLDTQGAAEGETGGMPSPPTYPDVNGDSLVTSADASLVMTYLNSTTSTSSQSGGSGYGSGDVGTGSSGTGSSGTGTSGTGGSGGVGSVGGGSCTTSGSGLQVSGPTTLAVNEADFFTAALCWQNAYYITIVAPHIAPGRNPIGERSGSSDQGQPGESLVNRCRACV